MAEQLSSSCPEAPAALRHCVAWPRGMGPGSGRTAFEKSASIRFRPLSPLDLSFPSCLASNTFLWSFSVFL